MKVDTLVMENDFVPPPPPELFLKFASAPVRCISVFSSKLCAAHLTNDFLKNAFRNGVTSIQIRRGPFDGGYYGVEEDAVLDYCFPKDGPMIEGRNVRLVQLRVGKTFVQNVVEVSKDVLRTSRKRWYCRIRAGYSYISGLLLYGTTLRPRINILTTRGLVERLWSRVFIGWRLVFGKTSEYLSPSRSGAPPPALHSPVPYKRVVVKQKYASIPLKNKIYLKGPNTEGTGRCLTQLRSVPRSPF